MHKLLKDKLVALADDDSLMQALKEVFEIRIEKEKPEVDKTDNDNVLGQKFRAYEQAKKILAETFTDILNYKETKNQTNDFDKSK